MQERPLLHKAKFFTEGVVRFSAAGTRRADVFAATNRGATQRMVSTGAKLDVNILMSTDCPGSLRFLRKTQLESETPHKNTLVT